MFQIGVPVNWNMCGILRVTAEAALDCCFFFFNDTATTEIYTLSLHDALPIFDPDEAESLGRDEKKPVVLVRLETSPDDVHGILHSKGVLTARGGATSHAAVVTRGLGIPCVAGCESIVVDFDEGEFRVGEKVVHRGDFVSIDGSSGEVYEGHIPTIDPDFTKETDLQTLLEWADQERRLQVWANADYPRDAKRAREFGAQGIGLDRTEHMFMETDRLDIMHEMILAAPEYRRVSTEVRT